MKIKNNYIVLGAGVTGLSAGIALGCKVFEKEGTPGGICNSYYLDLNHKKHFLRTGPELYRFEIGGGHWIFGASKHILDFINSLSVVKKYNRKSAAYITDLNQYVPYPLQNNIFYMPREIREKVIKEILNDNGKSDIATLQSWLKIRFGRTLYELFFSPFHHLYTAGLYTKITPQDGFKTPADKKLIVRGCKSRTPSSGYNSSFIYPKNGLDDLVRKMAGRCSVIYNKKAIKIETAKKEILFEDGSRSKYGTLISTLPLHEMVVMTGIKKQDPSRLPYTSVLVFNIGAIKGKRCPPYHWIYFSKSATGFFRVGFYSNVDNSFLPKTSGRYDRVSLYVEKAYLGGKRPRGEEVEKLGRKITAELQELGFISDVEIIDPIWIDTAYTWEYPKCQARESAISTLRKHDIYQIGRYGKWKFQGIADSIKDGLMVKTELKG